MLGMSRHTVMLGVSRHTLMPQNIACFVSFFKVLFFKQDLAVIFLKKLHYFLYLFVE